MIPFLVTVGDENNLSVATGLWRGTFSRLPPLDGNPHHPMTSTAGSELLGLGLLMGHRTCRRSSRGRGFLSVLPGHRVYVNHHPLPVLPRVSDSLK